MLYYTKGQSAFSTTQHTIPLRRSRTNPSSLFDDIIINKWKNEREAWQNFPHDSRCEQKSQPWKETLPGRFRFGSTRNLSLYVEARGGVKRLCPIGPTQRLTRGRNGSAQRLARR